MRIDDQVKKLIEFVRAWAKGVRLDGHGRCMEIAAEFTKDAEEVKDTREASPRKECHGIVKDGQIVMTKTLFVKCSCGEFVPLGSGKHECHATGCGPRFKCEGGQLDCLVSHPAKPNAERLALRLSETCGVPEDGPTIRRLVAEVQRMIDAAKHSVRLPLHGTIKEIREAHALALAAARREGVRMVFDAIEYGNYTTEYLKKKVSDVLDRLIAADAKGGEDASK